MITTGSFVTCINATNSNLVSAQTYQVKVYSSLENLVELEEFPHEVFSADRFLPLHRCDDCGGLFTKRHFREPSTCRDCVGLR